MRSFERLYGQKMIVHPVLFGTPGRPCGGANAEGQVELRVPQQVPHDGGFARSRRCGEDDRFSVGIRGH